MKLIDANVFIYAAGKEHPLRAPSKRALALVQAGELEANTDVEVLQEILNYYQRTRSLSLGSLVFGEALAVFASPFLITVAMMRSAEGILVANPELEARDAVHAAVVLEHSLEGIISADRGFDAISGIRRFDPRDL